jgi:hypothetical protein
MNLRLSLLLVAVLLLFGGTFLVVRFFGPNDRPPEEPWLYRIGEDTIRHIEVTTDGQTVVYNRPPGGFRWYIEGEPDIPVFQEKWSGTPLLLSGPRVNRDLAQTIDDPASYGLGPPVSIIKVTDRGGQSFEFHMGGTTPDENNTYARLVGHPTLFTVPAIWAQVINRLATDPPYLRLYQLQDDPLVYIEITEEGQKVAYGKIGGLESDWAILDPVELEPSENLVLADRWRDLPTMFNGPRVNDILADTFDNPAEYGLEPPQTKIRLGMAAGPDLEFYLGKTTPDGEHRSVSVKDKTELYAMPIQLAQRISELVTDPPVKPEDKPTPGSG